jgi:hypothetical protein
MPSLSMGELEVLRNMPQDKVQAYFKNRTPVLDDIIGLLNLSNRYPEVKFEGLGGSNGEYSPLHNSISLDPFYGNNVNTATHEHFHALDQAMGGYAYQLTKPFKDTTVADNRFLDTYNKLNLPPNLPGRDVRDRYRTNAVEERAFGVGNHSSPLEPHRPTAPHVDATNATEMAILMDMYRRALTSQKVK